MKKKPYNNIIQGETLCDLVTKAIKKCEKKMWKYSSLRFITLSFSVGNLDKREKQ